ncbi:FAD-binding oxidoreductase [Limibacillus halophilus]|uniref:FAD/FMN-containing dehydrogenase n=1 Tax=Limibacillus halophilus TaxID=1579333 RepID=A0A839T101_9PROT|nr:FAD-binding oxidoreductase [Limibacillus halophilus]MBB3066823.1 FAD/FMN-containing dehydrogenase [Limibacillus halophilus]
MSTTRLKTRDGDAVPTEAIDELKSLVRGDLIVPGSEQYETARRIWNALIDKHPGAILRCHGTADVSAAIKFASKHDILVSVRGGGHNVGGRAVCDDGLVIDLSRMRAIYVDPTSRTVRAQGGALLGDVDRETHVHGLAVPLGVVSMTGIGGLTTGGGFGWLARKYGPTCDNVIEAEVVTADGSIKTASAGQNPDLYWGICGGSGNFGIVTSFLYRAYPLSTVLGGMIAYPRAAAPKILRGYRDIIRDAPDELTVYAALLWGPDGTPLTALVPCWIGDDKEVGRQAIKALTEIDEPLVVDLHEMPFTAMQSMLDAAYGPGSRNYWKSAYLSDLTDDAIDTIVEQSKGMTVPGSGILIEHCTGATKSKAMGENAFAQRGQDYLIALLPLWTRPADDKAQIAWAKAAHDALAPFAAGGTYLNYIGADEDTTVIAAFGENLGRLREIKRTYDPTNFFRANANIAP